MADRRKLIVIDAIDAHLPPGTVVRLAGDELLPEPHVAVSLHQLALVDSLVMAKVLGCAPGEVVLWESSLARFAPGWTCPLKWNVPFPIASDVVQREV